MSSNSGAASIITFFTFSLLFTSLMTSWVLFNAYGVDVSPITVPIFYTNGGLDLTDTTGATDKNIVYEGSNWNFIAGTGLISTSQDSYMLFDNAGSPNGGAHENSYVITNPNAEDYSIVLSRSWVRTQEILVSSDGYHFIDSALGYDNEIYFAPYEGANALTDITVRTLYNPALGSGPINTAGEVNLLEFYVNEQPVFTIPNGVDVGSQLEPLVKAYYGGIGSKNNIGLTVKSFTTTASKPEKNAADIASMGLDYIWTVLKMIVWNIDSKYLPWEINLALIKSQEFAIGVGVWFWIRG